MSHIIIIILSLFQAAPWDDNNFYFLFCNEVVYPTDNYFISFRGFEFKKIFFINIFMKPKQTFCIPKHLLKDV